MYVCMCVCVWGGLSDAGGRCDEVVFCLCWFVCFLGTGTHLGGVDVEGADSHVIADEGSRHLVEAVVVMMMIMMMVMMVMMMMG